MKLLTIYPLRRSKIMKIFIFLCVAGVALFGLWFYSIDIRMKEESKKLDTFIEECIKNGGSIQEVGSILTSHKLICNTKVK